MNKGNGFNLELGKYQKQIDIRLQQMEKENFVRKLWNKDDSLWIKEVIQPGRPSDTFSKPGISMGWLNVVDKMLDALPKIEAFSNEIKRDGFDQIILLGMGGSSLAPFVMQKMFQRSTQGIKLTVLDCTEPDTIKKIESQINLATTLFIVSSKSGSTAEVMALFNYFYNEISNLKGDRAGENFIAITDEGTSLSELAKIKKFKNVFINYSNIGGRFSALSYFGIVPAVLMGINAKEMLERTRSMIVDCGPQTSIYNNPGVVLGVAIAELALKGCDKLTYLMPSELRPFGLWLEQLVAESTGKNGKGILPVDGNPLIDIDTYGKDRFFFKFDFMDEPDFILSEKLKDFTFMNFPLINISIKNELDLGKEFFRWEIATATAGAILGVNPFDQPNVEETKKYTKEAIKNIENEGKLPEMEISLVENDLRYYAEQKEISAESLITHFFSAVAPGDYIVLQAYTPEEKEVTDQLSEIQSYFQNNLHLAVSNQFGPRYLHSTGQYHKGGPNNGFYIQFISSSSNDIQIPGHEYTFDQLKKAQAIGDREALIKNKRRVILIDLGNNAAKGLNTFKEIASKIQSGNFVKEEKRIVA